MEELSQCEKETTQNLDSKPLQKNSVGIAQKRIRE